MAVSVSDLTPKRYSTVFKNHPKPPSLPGSISVPALTSHTLDLKTPLPSTFHDTKLHSPVKEANSLPISFSASPFFLRFTSLTAGSAGSAYRGNALSELPPLPPKHPKKPQNTISQKGPTPA